LANGWCPRALDARKSFIGETAIRWPQWPTNFKLPHAVYQMFTKSL
jgi:hypothetical protein